MRGDCRQGRVNVLIPAFAAGQNQCGRIGQVRDRLRPAAHQVRDVLAGLESAEETDVLLAIQAEGLLDTRTLSVIHGVED